MPSLLLGNTAAVVRSDDQSALVLARLWRSWWHLGNQTLRLTLNPDILLQSLESLGLALAHAEEDVDLID